MKMENNKEFIPKKRKMRNPVDKEILDFFAKHPKFSKMSSMKLCSIADSYSENDEDSFEGIAAYEIFAKVADVESIVSDPDYFHRFEKIDVKDKLATTHNLGYCGAISGKADGKDFVLVFDLYYETDEDREDFIMFEDFDEAINTVKDNDEEAMWMPMAALYM